MSGKKISALTESTTVPSNSYTIIVDGTVNKKIKLETITKNLSDRVNAQETTINNLSNRIDEINPSDTTISDLSNKVNTQETKINNLSNKVNTQGTTISSLSNRVNEVSEQLDNCATKSELGNYSLNSHTHTANSINGISNYATKSELSSYATKSELSNYATKDELNNHTHTDNPIGGVSEYVTKDELNNYATKDELNNYALDDHTHSVSSINGISNYATKNELSSYATKSELSSYALDDHTHTADSISGIDEYATKVELSNYSLSGHTHSVNSISGIGNYATKNELNSYATKNELNSYATKDELSSYATKDELNNYSLDGHTHTANSISGIGNYATKAYVETKYDELFQFVSNGKNLLASAITDMGVTTLATDTFEVMANNIRKITGSGGGTGGGGSEEPTTPITIGNINNITVNSGTTFNIVYTTNVNAVKHEISLNGGSSYNTIYPTGDKNGYTYEHEALTSTSSPYQGKIRVTDINGNIATSNTFSITVSSSSGGDTSNDITISQSSYTIQAGEDIKVNYISSIALTTCILLYAPDYNDNNYSGGYISATGEFTFYTSSRSAGTYTVKVKGRKFNDSTQVYEDYYSNIFTITITDNTSGGGGSEEPTTPITISNIDNITVNSGTTFNIVYTTNIDAVKHEISLDGGSSYKVINPTGDKSGYTYVHEALTSTSSPYQRKIRVTDANNNTATSNTFSITVNSNGSGGDTSNDITISPSSYTIQVGTDVKVNYTSSVALSTCMLLFAPNYSESNGYLGGYISNTNEFTFYTSNKSVGNYTVKVKGRKMNDSTQTYDDYYSDEFTIIIEDSSSGGGETPTPITISNISDMTVNSGSVFNIVYTTNVDAVKHEMSFDGGSTFNVIYPSGDKNGYTYEHEALTETSYAHQRIVRVTDANGNTATSNTFSITVSSGGSSGGGGGTTPITISNISDMTVNSGSTFNIVYTTNVDAVRHEMSFDGGSSYNVIYPSGDKYGYTYQHEALTETSYPHQRKIRVTDANGNTAISNTFNITVSSGGSSGGGGGSTKSPFLVSMYGDPRVIPNYPSGIQFPPINAHEDGIQPNGVNSTDSWKYGTRINQNPRSDWTRVGFWGQVYRQEGYGYDPDNVAVEIKDCKLWGWNGSSWVLIHDVSFSSSNTIFYVENFSGDSNRAFPSNLRLNGKNATAKFDSVNNGYMWHPYSGKARAGDYGLNQPYYYCSTMSARLVKWDSSGADNLDNAKLCFNVGGDFWHTTHETWQPDWSANGEYAQGQFIKCTREWRTAYCTNVPESWGNGFPSL